MKRVTLFVCAAALSILFRSSAQASTFCTASPGVVCEQPVTSDAGQYISTARYTDGIGPLNSIYGLINGLAGGDMYAISIQNTSAFSASFAPATGNYPNGNPITGDSQAGLFLFNSKGMGIEAGDDSTGLSGFNGVAGTYFIMITGDGNVPEYSVNGTNYSIFAPFVTGQDSLPVAGAGAVSAYSGGGCGTACAGGYEINLAGAGYSAVPEPASLALTGLLLSGLGLLSRLRRKSLL